MADAKYLHLDMEKTTDISREPDPDDEWDRGNTSASWWFGEAKLIESYAYNTYPVSGLSPGDICYIVVPVWSTGDTFGHDSSAMAEIFGVYKTRDEADEFVKELEADRSCSRPWNGYFESLDGIEILGRTVY